MTEYTLRRRTVSTSSRSGGKPTVDIPDDAQGIEVDYEEPVGMGKPSLKAHIKYLEPVEEDDDG